MDTILSIIFLLVTGTWAIATFVIANEREDLLPERTKATRQPRKYNIR